MPQLGPVGVNIVKDKKKPLEAIGNMPNGGPVWQGSPDNKIGTDADFAAHTSGTGSPTTAKPKGGEPGNWGGDIKGAEAAAKNAARSPLIDAFAPPPGAGYGSGSVFEGIGDYAGVFGPQGGPAAPLTPRQLDEIGANPEARSGINHFTNPEDDIRRYPESRSGLGHFVNDDYVTGKIPALELVARGLVEQRRPGRIFLGGGPNGNAGT
jgi:hypothetical protein